MERFEAAVEYLRTAVEERPWHQGSVYNLGQALMRFGRTGQAKTYLSRADRLEQQQSRIERVRAQAQDAPGEPEQWRKLGRVLRRAGRLEEARETFSVALYLRPQDSTLRNEVAKLASDLGNYEAAISHYRTLLRQRPSYVRGWFNLGVVYARKGEAKKAEKAWQTVLEHEPDHQKAKKYLSSLPTE